MKKLDFFLESGLYSDALDYLRTHGNPDSDEYLFYLGFIEVHLARLSQLKLPVASYWESSVQSIYTPLSPPLLGGIKGIAVKLR